MDSIFFEALYNAMCFHPDKRDICSVQGGDNISDCVAQCPVDEEDARRELQSPGRVECHDFFHIVAGFFIGRDLVSVFSDIAIAGVV